MKKYIGPKIKAIQLDPEQAILEVCAVSGVYLNSSPTPWCGTATGAGPFCNTTPKGGTGAGTQLRFPGAAQATAPS